MDFQKQDGGRQDERFETEQETHLQDSPAVAADPGRSLPVVVMAPNANGVVVLPAGTELADIRVDGRDLVVIGADGVRYVIPDGAIIVPQLVVDGVAIPPLNLAALLTGNEPQPAAGNPQSSGGNFAGPVGPLQDAYGLGDLLPYTELNFPQPEEREIIPARPDREPDVVVVTPDQPAGATAATAQVDEAGLPARPGEPAGTASAAASETTIGTILYNAPDGLTSVTINGTPITTVGQTVPGTYGVLTVTSVAPGVIGYSYTLADNLVGLTGPDNFTVEVTDVDGDVATATLDISIIDDAPIAANDADTVAAGTYGPELGNVLTGAGTTSGSAGADQQGADGAQVSGVTGFAGSDTSFDEAGNLVVGGQYGTLTIKADGSYSYVRTPGTAGGVTDSFTYTLTDDDGSSDTAVLTITIQDSPAAVASLSGGTAVDEAGLPARPDGGAPGTEAPTDVESTTGTITVVAPDGVASVSIGDVVVTGAGQVITVPQGTFTITGYDPVAGTVTYAFTLTDNTVGDSTVVTVPITVTDIDGDSDTKPLTITIIDDHPIAVDDAATQSPENSPVTVDVFANDIQGADNVAPTTVALVPGTLSGAGSLANNGDGTFTYTPAPAEQGTVTFDYSITDGDGDVSTATVVITLQADSTPTIDASGDTDVLEAGLPARGSEPAGTQFAGDGELATGAITITAGGDTIGSLVINNTDVTAGGTVTTSKGVLTVTPDGTGGYTYSYLLTDNTLSDPDSDSFALTITDSDGSAASTTLVVAIVDDTPSAADDAASLAAGTYGPIGGNVLANDTQGADGAGVTSYAGTGAAVAAGDVATGVYGTLTIAADGTFSYTRNPGSPGGVTDTFTYTITDGDGDPATATLVITVPNSDTSLDVPTAGEAGTSVLEEALATGSNPTSPGEATSGTIGFTAPDGPAILTIDGVPITVGATIAGAFGTLVIDAVGANTISYTYTLTTNTSGDNTADSFTVRVEDQDGDFTENDLVVGIVDDVPTALPDTDTVTEDGPLSATGNVITDAEANGDAGADTQGADGAVVTAFSGTGGAGVAGDTIVGTYGTLTLGADGTYTYTLDNANPLVQGLDSTESLTDTFDYTITDGDSDPSSSTLTITIAGDDDGITITGLVLGGAELTFDEDDLALGSSPDPTMLTKTGTFEVVALDGIVTISIGGETIYSGGAFLPGQSIVTAYGTLTFTGVSEDTVDASGDVTKATVSYSYELNANTLTHTGADDLSLTDSYTITVVDTDNTVATDTLDIQLIDDVPTGIDDSETQQAEDANITIDVFTNDVKGADGALASTVALVPGSQIGGGVLTNNGDGTFTLDPAAGQTGTVTFQYTFVDRDGDLATATATITLLGDSTPTAATPTDLVVDEDGLLGANLDALPLQTDPFETDSTESDTQSGTVVVNFGNDVPADLLAAFALLDTSGLDGQLANLNGTPVTFELGTGADAGVLIGSADGNEVIRISVTGAVAGPGIGQVTYTYTALLSEPVQHIGQGEGTDILSGVSFQVTDGDGDQLAAPGTFSVTVVDDVPSASDLTGSTYAEGSGAHDLGVAATVLGIQGGADGLSSTPITFANQGATGGTLTIDGTGHLIYTSPTNVTSSTTVTETFSYTVTDKDGDAITKTVTFGVSDTGITNVSATNELVDEDDILGANGLTGGPGDDAPVTTGHISYTLGQDALQSIALSVTTTGLTKLDGVTAVSTSWDPTTNTLTGYGTSTADVVFTITLTNITATGADYNMVLLQPVKHPGHDDPSTAGTIETSFEDNLSFNVGVTVTDADNSTGTTSFTVTIDDDSPSASDLTGSTYAEGSGAHDLGVAATVLGIQGGADGLSSTPITFANQGATGGTLTIDGTGHLIYTSPTNVTSSTTVTETFSYTVTDKDGDAITKTVTFGVSDTGITNVSATNELVDEDDILGANGLTGGPGDDAPVTTGHISYTLGQDALQSIALSVTTTGLTKLDGVTAVSTSWDPTTNTLTGYGTSTADVVFTITLTNITATGADYNMVLLQPVKHPGHDDPSTAGTIETSFEDNLSFNVGVTVTDADNSTGTTSFTVTIDDDSPSASDLTGSTYAEGSGAHDLGVAATVLGIQGGADGLSSTPITFANQGATGGTLTIDGTGHLIYTSPTNVTSSTTVTETFSYTVTDKDGDAITKTVTFGVSDTGITNVSATNELVDEDDILGANGLTGGPGDDAPVTTGHISYTLGQDALQSIALSVTTTGLTKLDGVTAVSTSWDPTTNTLTGYGTSTADVVFTITLTNITATGADYNMVLLQPVKHPGHDDPSTAGTIETSFEDNLSFNVGVTVTDADNSTGTTSFTVTIDDDSPEVIDPDPITNTLFNKVGETATASLDADGDVSDNFGADGPGTITFANISDGDPSGLFHNSQPVLLYVTSGGTVVEGRATINGVEELIFTITLDQANSEYDVVMTRTLDDGSGAFFNDLSGGVAGNPPFKLVESTGSADATELLFTPRAGGSGDLEGSINSDQDDLGVNGQFIDLGFGVSIDFGDFTYAANAGGTDDDAYIYVADGDVNGFRFTIDQISQGSVVDLTLKAYDYNATPDGQEQQLPVEGNYIQDDITGLDIFNTTGAFQFTVQIIRLDATNFRLNILDNDGVIVTTSESETILFEGRTFSVADSLAGNTVTVENLPSDWKVETYTADGYDRITIDNTGTVPNTDGKFSISELQIAQTNSGTPLNLLLDLQIADGDGDTQLIADGLDITFQPAALEGTFPIADATFAMEARTAQRTAEVVTTAAVAAALVNATSLAAAVAPAVETDHFREMPNTEQTHVRIEMIDTASSSARPALFSEALAENDTLAVATRDLGQLDSDDRRPALADLTEREASGPDHMADDALHTVTATTASLLAGTGTEGLMQALMALAPGQAPAIDGGTQAEAVLANALSDFAGAKLVDTIVDHFTGGDVPAIALVANDTASALLVQLGDGAGMSAPFHDVMTALADADATALAAAQT